MRYYTLILISLYFVPCSSAQNVIEKKYKNPKIKGKIIEPNATPDVPVVKVESTEQQRKDAELKAFNPNGNEVWIYEHINYNGQKKVLLLGDYNLAKLGNNWNDKISSMLVPKILTAVVYMDDNYSNATTKIEGWGIASLRSTNKSWIGDRSELTRYNDWSTYFLMPMAKT